jgi:large subunit ribosomal protein L19
MKTEIIENFNNIELEKIKASRNFEIPDFKSGDTIVVKYKIVEGSSSRIQAFKGVVIALSKSKKSYLATFTVRKISSSIGVERRFPLYSPLITSIEILKCSDVRRAKLYYLRGLTGKASRLKEKLVFDAQKNKSISETANISLGDNPDISDKNITISEQSKIAEKNSDSMEKSDKSKIDNDK